MRAAAPTWTGPNEEEVGIVERLTAVVVLVLGGLLVLATAAGVAHGRGDRIVVYVPVLLLVLVGMWRAGGHLHPAPPAG